MKTSNRSLITSGDKVWMNAPVLTPCCWRWNKVLPSNFILVHADPPLFLWLDFFQIILQPVVSHVLILGHQGWGVVGWQRGRAGELRLWRTLQSSFGASQASDGTLVLLSCKDWSNRRLPGIFSNWAGGWAGGRAGVHVWRQLLLTGCRETFSHPHRSERTDRAVRVTWIRGTAVLQDFKKNNLNKLVFTPTRVRGD